MPMCFLMKEGGFERVGRWGGPGRSGRRGNQNQNTLYGQGDPFFIKKKKRNWNFFSDFEEIASNV